VRAAVSWQGTGATVAPTLTFVVMPHTDLPHPAQTMWGGNLEDVQAVPVEGSVSI
jgi:hypothetical protein